jgi:metal-sulfur cluster biosynthetic enzyme
MAVIRMPRAGRGRGEPASQSDAIASRILAALDGVYDPELDEPITKLRFMTACEISPNGDVRIRLCLPTPRCAPNFARMMAADAHDAVRRLPGVRNVTVALEEHYTGGAINPSLTRDDRPASPFPGVPSGDEDLRALRRLFQGKALLARQMRICETLIAAGESPEEVCARTVETLPDGADARRCMMLRSELQIESDAGAAAFVLPGGTPIAADQLGRWLRLGRLVRMSLDAGGQTCRSLLAIRYEAA